MGETKLLLPWKNSTILATIVATLSNAGIKDIIIVIRPGHDNLLESIFKLSIDFPIRPIFNDSFKPEDMLSSIQYGLKAIKPSFTAALIVLGDQPQLMEKTIHQIIRAHQQTNASIVIPSFLKRRGHPWLISKALSTQFCLLKYPQTPRDFLNKFDGEITYVTIDNDSILKDIDTPEDYQEFRP